MAKTDGRDTGDLDVDGGEGIAAAPAKAGFPKSLFGNRKMMLISVAVIVLLLVGGGVGLYYFLFDRPGAADASATQQAVPAAPPQVAYFDLPDLLVNIQTAEGGSAYLKLSLSLEVSSEEEKTGLQVLAPRIVDQMQSYLRELRTDDLKGSAGIMRLKEELLRRVNAAAAPYRIRDVLFKEIVVQ
jgi:flagellar protein FliL